MSSVNVGDVFVDHHPPQERADPLATRTLVVTFLIHGVVSLPPTIARVRNRETGRRSTIRIDRLLSKRYQRIDA